MRTLRKKKRSACEGHVDTTRVVMVWCVDTFVSVSLIFLSLSLSLPVCVLCVCVSVCVCVHCSMVLKMSGRLLTMTMTHPCPNMKLRRRMRCVRTFMCTCVLYVCVMHKDTLAHTCNIAI